MCVQRAADLWDVQSAADPTQSFQTTPFLPITRKAKISLIQKYKIFIVIMSTYIKYCGYITDITGGTNSSLSGTNSSWDYNLVHISWQIKCPRTFSHKQ